MANHQYSVGTIASLLGVRLPAEQDSGIIDTLLTDSRKLVAPATSLFVALEGPQRNGHLFIPELYKKGVRYFVVAQPVDETLYPGAVFLKVKDTLEALQQLAAAHRGQYTMEVVGITGSNGKTVVKEWIYQLLQPYKNIVRSPKSYNSQLGVPLSVWQMNPDHNLALFEAGISRPGEMERLERVIAPTIGVLTNIGPAHSEGFESDTAKLDEKLKLFKNAGVIIANGDNALIAAGVRKYPAVFFSWGTNESNAVQVLETVVGEDATRVRLKEQNKDPFEIVIPFTDQASAENAVTCAAVLLWLQMAPATIINGMKTLQPVNMRMEFKQGINNCIVINDSYSADLNSLTVALEFLQQQAKGRKKTVILSDLPENREEEQVLYRTIAAQLQRYGVDRLIGIGERMQSFLAALPEAAAIPERSFYLSTREFLQHFQSTRYHDEYILVKGARRFGFERIVTLLEHKVHETVLEINLDAVAQNLKIIQQRLNPGVKIMAMVKAFGYGSGASEIGAVVQFHKADYLGVAYADEGVELRKAGITIPIMVLNTEASAFDALTDYHLEPDLFSFELLEAFEQHVRNSGLKQYPVHIEIETGMNRTGFAINDIAALGTCLKNNEWIKVRSVFSHLAASEDNVEDAFTRHQYHLLKTAAAQLEKEIGYPFIKHIANTAAILRFPQLQLDMVRLGIGLYGISGSDQVPLETVATLKTTISQIKKIRKGETVSYNRRGVAKEDSVIATLRIGYADGYSRRLGNGVGRVWVNGQLAPVIGTICMDMTMIDITHIPGVKEGDDVIIFGRPVPVQQLAEWIGTIPYEIMTGISQRVKRVYYGEG
ncbi:bifunctional UDP-N-acetylmuramoyl-tripeptide:D-alanyl-D-alanine ligase/alanine racemase [Niabella beijingensis]|uniref:bifunctional UDP-N-acetylmuramoyl-tripeptide:D-alanyl-D-alanine ligase/alanine racemase n=1 Tax=Niabella beijingensis TaxID=2872700 RepID=UPI001CBCEF22|nr:bifunctional UDP-N-acetylmuramoyl-tripeptide:D-alanyl-D-alanine ligase/alanine racemase [Niabella beijingensis]MBZ4189709.1 bifunctional UDP-N-acetylmuramoyl-tripeptide:D-alanyl-D-alanine ligase/alanine racemase [Niabella beijingensis]